MMDPKSFTTRYNGLANRLVNEVEIADAYSDDSQRPNNRLKYRALWDTGATATLITQRVVDGHNLQAISFTRVATANGVHDSPVFLVSIWLPNLVVVPSVKVTQGELKGEIDLLIGMDIIGMGDFVVNNKDGITTFSFRVPSLECIDYTRQQQYIRQSPDIGRNAPCPCGSGKKYKQCHGKN